MRFLMFNAVVALALLYLFTGGDRPQDKAAAAMGSLKTIASRAVDDVREKLDKPHTPVMVAKAPAPAPRPKPERKPAPIAEAAPPAAPAQPVQQIQPEKQATVLPKPAPEPMPDVPPVPVGKVTVAKVAAPESPSPAPEVAKRRAEVLAESTPPTDDETRAVEIGAGPLMTPEERRKALLRLSEDMELFSVGVSGQ